jgi:hypothetical protein
MLQWPASMRYCTLFTAIDSNNHPVNLLRFPTPAFNEQLNFLASAMIKAKVGYDANRISCSS